MSWSRRSPRRTRTVALALLAALIYGTSYARLSRRGLREAGEHGLPGFLYVPAATVEAGGLGWNDALAVLFAPANAIDRLLFRGPRAASPFDCRLTLKG